MSEPITIERMALSVSDLEKASNISRTVIYEHIRAGQLETFKVGRSRRITAAAAKRWIESLAA